MSTSSSSETPPSSGSRPGKASPWGYGLIALLALPWASLSWKLTTDWSTNAQYAFGYWVPFFIGYLLFLRWKDRPAFGKPMVGLSTVAVIAGLLVLLPVRIVQEANPDWRPWNWVHAFVVVGITLAAAGRMGGLPWVRHFWPPLILIFTALPWTLSMEQGVIQALSRLVTVATTAGLNLVGIAAQSRGNVIELATGALGVEDACSGVRSVAGTLMSAVFFGEYFRLRWGNRGILLVLGLIVAVILNMVRSFILGWIGATQGIEAIHTWHDQAGLVILFIAFAILWKLASWLESAPTSKFPPARPMPTLPPLWAMGGIACWLLCVELGTEAWYRHGEQKAAQAPLWEPAFASNNDHVFKPLPVSDEVRAILRYSDGMVGILAGREVPRWHVNYFRWEPGRSSAQLAVMHRPETCMPASGAVLEGRPAPVTVTLEDMEIPFECSSFLLASGEHIHVFRTLLEEKTTANSSLMFDQSVRGRLTSAWIGKRNLGQRLLQVNVFYAKSFEVAAQDLQKRLPDFLKISKDAN